MYPSKLQHVVHASVAKRFGLFGYVLRLQEAVVDLTVQNSILKDRLQALEQPELEQEAQRNLIYGEGAVDDVSV